MRGTDRSVECSDQPVIRAAQGEGEGTDRGRQSRGRQESGIGLGITSEVNRKGVVESLFGGAGGTAQGLQVSHCGVFFRLWRVE